MRFKSLTNILVISLVVLFSFIIVWAANDVTLGYPVDGATNWTNEVTFNCSVATFEALSDVNLTLYHNQSGTWTNVSTNDSVGDGEDTLFTVTIVDGQDFAWNCLAENGTDQYWATANFTINIDDTNPTAFNFTAPANISTTNATTNTTPLFDWNDTVDANFLNYTLILTDSNNFASPNYSYELVGAVTNSSFRIGTDSTANGSISTALEDGLWYWKVIAYDGAEVNGSTLQSTNISIDDGTNSGYYEYELDNTNPTAVITCSPATVFQTETVTCGCTGSDNLDSDPTESYTASPSTAIAGTFSVGCTVTDNAGNTGSSTASYKIVALPVYGGSGGGGSSSVTRTNTVSLLEANSAHTFTITDSSINVNSVKVKSNINANNVKLSVKNYEEKPDLVSKSDNDVYQYLEISLTNLENKNLDFAEINFEVSKAWLSESEINKDDVILLRYSDSSWEELETTFVKMDGDNYIYVAKSAGFSIFAISYKELVALEEKSDSEEITEQVIDIVKEYNTKTYVALFAVIIILIFIAIYNKQISEYIKKNNYFKINKKRK
jgi:PGF-pre-PGF domain-containing protein